MQYTSRQSHACRWKNLLYLILRGTQSRAKTWGTGGTAPKFEVGDGPCSRPPNILRSSVCQFVRCARKREQSKKGVMKELFSEKGSYAIIHTVKIYSKNLKNTVDD